VAQFFEARGETTRVTKDSNPHGATALQRRFFEHQVFDQYGRLREVNGQQLYTKRFFDIASGPRSVKNGLMHVQLNVTSQFSHENMRRLDFIQSELFKYTDQINRPVLCTCLQSVNHNAQPVNRLDIEVEPQPGHAINVNNMAQHNADELRAALNCQHLANYDGDYINTTDSLYYQGVYESANAWLHANPTKASFDILHVFKPLINEGTTTFAGEVYGEFIRQPSENGSIIVYAAKTDGFSYYEHPDRYSELYYFNSMVRDGISVQVLDRFRNGDEDYILIQRCRALPGQTSITNILNVDYAKREIYKKQLVNEEHENIIPDESAINSLHGASMHDLSHISEAKSEHPLPVPNNPDIQKGINVLSLLDLAEGKGMLIDRDGKTPDLFVNIKGELKAFQVWAEHDSWKYKDIYKLVQELKPYNFTIPVKVFNEAVRKVMVAPEITEKTLSDILLSLTVNHHSSMDCLDRMVPIIQEAVNYNNSIKMRIKTISTSAGAKILNDFNTGKITADPKFFSLLKQSVFGATFDVNQTTDAAFKDELWTRIKSAIFQ
jgi:hypothetical protein